MIIKTITDNSKIILLTEVTQIKKLGRNPTLFNDLN